ncbi:unnamed protein product [Prorocentrum cordatum]|uniref:FAD-binding domain-containing protein n=1 Tax=Prorocentrum cordatum TaxID=2364126 RepID=A0ABN9TW96_9DINO|nr:unnamed protein product [Polarella glacialis]
MQKAPAEMAGESVEGHSPCEAGRAQRAVTSFRQTFSTFPEELRILMQSREFLQPPTSSRACRAHEADPRLEDRLKELKSMEESLGEQSFRGQYAVCRGAGDDPETFIAKVDAALIYYRKSKLELRREAGQKQEQAGCVMDTFNIVVIGGGPTGLLCAIEAAILGHHVDVVETRPSAVRARAVGLYPETMVTLARLGAPAEMFNDNLLWCDKAGATIFDLEFFLSQIALKLGVTIYRNATAVVTDSISQGVLQVRRRLASGRTVHAEGDELGLVRLRHSTQQVLAIESFELSFDKIVNCEGSTKRDFSEALVGDKGNASASMMATAADTLEVVGMDRQAYLTGWDSHIDKVINEVDWIGFTEALRDGSVPCEVQCFVCNMPRQVFRMGPRDDGLGDYEVPHLMASCPVDWIAVPVPPNQSKSFKIRGAMQADPTSKGQLYSVASSTKDAKDEYSKGLAASFGLEDKLIERIQFEGMFLGSANHILNNKKPFEVFTALLRALDVIDDVDDRGLSQFMSQENGFDSPAQNAMGVFKAAPVALRTEHVIPNLSEEKRQFAQLAHGFVPCSKHRDHIEYFILGDSLHSAWYRWGVGLLDAAHSAKVFGQSLLEHSFEGRSKCMRALESRMAKRAVHTMAYFYHFNSRLAEDHRMLRFVKELDSKQSAEVLCPAVPPVLGVSPQSAVHHVVELSDSLKRNRLRRQRPQRRRFLS